MSIENHLIILRKFFVGKLNYDYFGASKYKNTPIARKRIFGNQTANKEGTVLAFASSVKTCIKSIYKKLRVSPIPIFKPVPPLRFWVDKLTPINVRINVENGKAKRLYSSTL